jgi:hypothetical protein
MSATASIPTPVQFAAIASSTVPGDHPGEWGNMTNARDLATQLVLSGTLGLSALFSFCVCSFFSPELYRPLTDRCDSFSGQNGQSCMLHEGKDGVRPPSYPNYRIVSLAGFP